MRIPSQFNEDTLYGQRAKRTSSVGSYRRIFRLCIALVLVVVVMGQAADPRIYEAFFGQSAEDAILEESGGDANIALNQATPANVNSGNVAENPSDSAQPKIEIDQATLIQANALVAQQSINDQRQWVVILDRWQSGETFPLMRSVVPLVVDQVSGCDELTDAQIKEWADTLEKFGQLYGTGGIVVSADDSDDRDDKSESTTAGPEDTGQPKLTSEDTNRLNAWLAALDQAAVDRIVDGAVWRSQDFDAFYRQIDQAQKLSEVGATKVTVVPLMQQHKVYLGKRVRVAGRVARVTRRDASANPFGVKEYWEIWIKPSTGGDRPFLLILDKVPQVVKDHDGEDNVYRGPQISVVGRFFKRLAYASKIGVDSAPVIVGRLISRPATPVATAVATESESEMKSRFWLTVALALIAGLSVTGIVMWRTGIAAKESREIRKANVQASPEFLGDLADVETKPKSFDDLK